MVIFLDSPAGSDVWFASSFSGRDASGSLVDVRELAGFAPPAHPSRLAPPALLTSGIFSVA
jgi:hypothetical protein